MQSTSRTEAERLLGIAEKLLQGKDLNGCRDFALLAQETEPLLDGSDQILAVVDVLIAADKRINNSPDWYAVLQLDSRRNDHGDLIKRQYRRLALLLHPDKNKFPFADSAFKLVADAWALLSDAARKSAYDNEVFAFSKVDLASMRKQREKEDQNQNHPIQRDKIPVRRNPADVGGNHPPATAAEKVKEKEIRANIWTACPYCYNLYEYPNMYVGCCLRCSGCNRAFQVVAIPPASLPPAIPGKEAYYCCMGYFPMGFAMADSETAKSVVSIPNWMPPMFPTNAKAWPSAESLPNGSRVPLAEPVAPNSTPTPPPSVVAPPKPVQQKKATTPAHPPTTGATVPRKRGRPRKNPLP